MFQSNDAASQIGQPPCMMVWLTRDVHHNGVGAWAIERVSVKTEEYRQEVRYNKAALASERLAKSLWDFLQSYLPPTQEAFVLTARDTVLQTRSLLLNGLEVTATAAIEGTQRVLLKFRHIIGAFQAVFAPNQVPDLMEELKCTLSLRTLNDIILPALNLAASEPAAQFKDAGQRIEAFVDRLRQNKNEIEFYSILLSRFLASREAVAPEAQARLEDPDGGPEVPLELIRIP